MPTSTGFEVGNDFRRSPMNSDLYEVGKACRLRLKEKSAKPLPTSTEVSNDFRKDAMNSDTKKITVHHLLSYSAGEQIFLFSYL